jgi:hypothetical protein
MSNGIETLIYQYNAKLYEHYKTFIPCFNGKCPVSTMCCEEKKASRGAKHLAYRIRLKDPCKEGYDILGAIESMPRLNELVEYHKSRSVLHFTIHKILKEQLTDFKSKFKILENNSKIQKGKKKVEFGNPYFSLIEYADELNQLI